MKAAIIIAAVVLIAVLFAVGVNMIYQGVDIMDIARAVPKAFMDYMSDSFSGAKLLTLLVIVGVASGVAYVNGVPGIKTRR